MAQPEGGPVVERALSASRNWGSTMKSTIKLLNIVFFAALIGVSQFDAASAQIGGAFDPAAGLVRLFGLGGQACKQYDDSGRLYIYSEGYPSIGVIVWLQQSDGGRKPNIPMPQELADALPYLPGCMLGRHHAAHQVKVDQDLRQIAMAQPFD